jgi:alpha-ketoglutarate-dependent taurine dioxygenase
MEDSKQCPRCGARLRAWSELNEEEREVVRRLPGSADYSLEERQSSHQWCTRCWYEESAGVARNA